MTETLPLVSVITICRNIQDVILNTLNCISTQDYPEIEYIIIDGASTDGTKEKIESFINTSKIKHIKFISESDTGISDAMNKGIKASSGKLVVHLHGGDKFIDHSILTKIVQSWQKHHWRWGIASSNVVDTKGNIKHTYKPLPNVATLLRKNGVPHQSTFLDRDIFLKHGLFDINLHQAMDYEFWLRIAFKGKEVPFSIPFITTEFLEGGASSNIIPLLIANYKLRRKLNDYGESTSLFKDITFLGRIFLFGSFQKLKSSFS